MALECVQRGKLQEFPGHLLHLQFFRCSQGAQEVPGPALVQPPLAWDGGRGCSLLPGFLNTDPGENSHVPQGSETSQPPAHPDTQHQTAEEESQEPQN